MTLSGPVDDMLDILDNDTFEADSDCLWELFKYQSRSSHKFEMNIVLTCWARCLRRGQRSLLPASAQGPGLWSPTSKWLGWYHWHRGAHQGHSIQRSGEEEGVLRHYLSEEWGGGKRSTSLSIRGLVKRKEFYVTINQRNGEVERVQHHFLFEPSSQSPLIFSSVCPHKHYF
jgi:hypothetical protein